ncbi:MAG: hypothetical protein ABR530_06090 [Pyrinomonadaceae bacterium]
MKRAFHGVAGIILLVTVFAVSVGAQTPPAENPPAPQPPAAVPTGTPGCPKIGVKTSTQPIRDGAPVKFTASVAGGDPKVAALYDWSITGGSVTAGQGTLSIVVDSTGAGTDKAITATLLVGGYAPECVMTATATAPIAGPAQKVDEFGALSEEEQGKRLDSFMAFVTPAEQAYVIAYGGKVSPRGTAYNNLKKIRTHLMKGGAPNERIITIDGGYREEPFHELWLVPIGAEPPRPNPTVDPKEVTPPKPQKTPAPHPAKKKP